MKKKRKNSERWLRVCWGSELNRKIAIKKVEVEQLKKEAKRWKNISERLVKGY